MGYVLDDDPARVDLDVVWAFLSEHAYWSRWRTREDVQRQLQTAWRVIGAYDEGSGAQVGFARAVSDGVSVAYLADLFVLPEHRGHELGKAIATRMVDEGPGTLFRWLLHTADAHGLYAALGFAAADPTVVMERPARR